MRIRHRQISLSNPVFIYFLRFDYFCHHQFFLANINPQEQSDHVCRQISYMYSELINRRVLAAYNG
ncbi:hypothetical protein NIES3275_55620 [Microchaete diplosiphon NIES-3275]|nr:hypothetical protein NIES3275_55620 [Microchaete diplosiphon NIES-3275]